MLQTHKPPLVQTESRELSYGVSYSADQSPSELFAAVVGFLRRQFSVILPFVLLTTGLAAGYVLTTPPLYAGQATLMIDAARVQVLPEKRSILGDDPPTYAMVESQIEILKSRALAESVVNDLDLTQDPEFVEPARPVAIARGLLSRLFGSNKKEAKSKLDLTKRAVKTFEDRLMVSRVGTSFVVDIRFLSTNPDRAAQIANAVADAFIADQSKAKYETIRKATSWLQDRLDELLGQASAAERAVVDYKAKNNIVDNTAGHTVNEQKVSELNTALIKARADTMEVKARLDRVSQVLRAGDVDPAAEELGTIADTLRSEIINNLRLKYLELARRESIFSNEYGSTHLAVVKVRNEMAEVRHSIVQELKRIAQAAKSDYEIAKARENSLESSLAATVADSRTTDKAQIELRQLESAAQTYRALYETFQQRYTDSIQQQSLPMADARIVSRASPPEEKSSPKSLLILAAATMGGLVLGLGLGILREISDRGFRTSRHVEAKLKSECIALVPMDSFKAKAAPFRTRAATECVGPRTISPRPDLFRYLVDSPLSPFAEAIRAIKVNIDRKAATKSGNVIGITSSLPNEGKSTIAASLAQVAADGGARVILVDCDLRKPSLSRELAPNATHGLVDVVKSTIRLDEVIWSDPSTQLSFLPAGIGSRFIHTNELLASDAMKRLFVQLRESYDYVIVDLSPVVPVVDVRSATHLVDSFVFVVKWGETKVDVAEHSLHSAHGIYENLVGVVLNQVSFKLLNRYEGHGNYYDHRYYVHYGYTD